MCHNPALVLKIKKDNPCGMLRKVCGTEQALKKHQLPTIPGIVEPVAHCPSQSSPLLPLARVSEASHPGKPGWTLQDPQDLFSMVKTTEEWRSPCPLCLASGWPCLSLMAFADELEEGEVTRAS